jgi:tetratricopeptide (TPR) repeat protein
VAALKPIARRLLDYVASRYVVDGLPELVARVTELLQSTRPDDLESVALYAEGLGAVGRAPEGVELVKGVIAAQKGKRTREVGLASFALYRLEASLGDYPASLESLTRAFECQPSNARVALELGQLALHLANVELAQRAYRSVTLMKPDAPGGPVPQDKALAFLSLGDIAAQQGDARRARAMYEKALSEEPSYEVARERIAALG